MNCKFYVVKYWCYFNTWWMCACVGPWTLQFMVLFFLLIFFFLYSGLTDLDGSVNFMHNRNLVYIYVLPIIMGHVGVYCTRVYTGLTDTHKELNLMGIRSPRGRQRVSISAQLSCRCDLISRKNRKTIVGTSMGPWHAACSDWTRSAPGVAPAGSGPFMQYR